MDRRALRFRAQERHIQTDMRVLAGRIYSAGVSLPESLRDPVAKDESYPVGRAALDRALDEAGATDVSMVYFLRWGIEEWRHSGHGRSLTVTFTAATARSAERLEVRVHDLPTAAAPPVREAMGQVLPKVASWIAEAQGAENVWRSHDHELVAYWDGERISLTAS